MGVPNRLTDARRFFETIDLRDIQSKIAQEAHAQLVIIGPVNSGKSTLFNMIKGQKLSHVSAVPGTTRQIISEQFGPFWLVDTPGVGEVAGSETTAEAHRALDRDLPGGRTCPRPRLAVSNRRADADAPAVVGDLRSGDGTVPREGVYWRDCRRRGNSLFGARGGQAHPRTWLADRRRDSVDWHQCTRTRGDGFL